RAEQERAAHDGLRRGGHVVQRVTATGRVRDQWHTMTRTGVAPRLSQHTAEPYAELHPIDARALGIAPASLTRISNVRGSIVVRALVTDRQRRGSVLAPFHWSDQNASAARVDALIAANVDPISGQPESKACSVKVEPWPAAWFGFALTRKKPGHIPAGYWALARTHFGWRIELADTDSPPDWRSLAGAVLDGPKDADWSLCAVEDQRAGDFRWLAREHDKAMGLLIVSRQPVAASRAFLCEQFESVDGWRAMSLLAGRPPASGADHGRALCVCHGVGSKDIESAIEDEELDSVEAIGRITRAGTGCGSCKPEIARMLHEMRQSTHGRRLRQSPAASIARLEDA
ncbi:MAG: (2Fe-2S)-binding protein, partial [Methylocystis sp.]|nr:(2Fe-2S)-binding protein [Methylocystis sp.]